MTKPAPTSKAFDLGKLAAMGDGTTLQLARKESGRHGTTLVLQTGEGSEVRLSPMRLQVARLAALGGTIKGIAAFLDRSESTVRGHLERAYKAVGVTNRASLLLQLLSICPEELLAGAGEGRSEASAVPWIETHVVLPSVSSPTKNDGRGAPVFYEWHCDMDRRLELEQSFEALEPIARQNPELRWYAEQMRAMMRIWQHRVPEALVHLEAARLGMPPQEHRDERHAETLSWNLMSEAACRWFLRDPDGARKAAMAIEEIVPLTNAVRVRLIHATTAAALTAGDYEGAHAVPKELRYGDVSGLFGFRATAAYHMGRQDAWFEVASMERAIEAEMPTRHAWIMLASWILGLTAQGRWPQKHAEWKRVVEAFDAPDATKQATFSRAETYAGLLPPVEATLRE